MTAPNWKRIQLQQLTSSIIHRRRSFPTKFLKKNEIAPSMSRKHICQYHKCSQAFIRKEHLTRHLLTHTSVKPFECISCHRPFARQDALKRHAKTHSSSESSSSSDGGSSPRSYTDFDISQERSWDLNSYAASILSIENLLN